MTSVEELIEQYDTDSALQKEVADILADGKVTVNEFLSFVRKHDVDISLKDMPKYMEEARKLGFIQ